MESSNCLSKCTIRKTILIITLFSTSIITVFLYMGNNPSGTNYSSQLGPPQPQKWKDSIESQTTNSTKYILFWTKFFYTADFYFGLGRKPFLKYDCPITDCFATDNRKLFKKFHALIFHLHNFNPKDLPDSRSPEQLYVFYDLEPVIKTDEDVPNNFYNISMTYKFDSDISLPYFYYRKVNRDAPFFKLETKPKSAAWFASNCDAQSKRQVIVKELQKYIQIDIYGPCGTHNCSRENETKCDEILREYKFYLAFENSLCPDYVTEKFYRALTHAVIPVVYALWFL